MLNLKELRKLVRQHYDLKVTNIAKITSGAINFSYKIETVGGKAFFLRVYAPSTYLGVKTFEQISDEIEYIQLMKSSGLLIPALVENKYGKNINNEKGVYWVLFQFSKGEHLLGELNNTYALEIGQVVGEMHNIIEEKRIITNRGWFGKSFVDHAVEKISNTTNEFYKDEIEDIKRNYDQIKIKLKESKMYALHGDIHLGNIFLENNKIVILDFDSIQTGHFEQDLANHMIMTIFKAVLTGTNFIMNEKAIDLFIEGYKYSRGKHAYDPNILLFYCKITRLLLLLDYENRMSKKSLKNFALKSNKVLKIKF